MPSSTVIDLLKKRQASRAILPDSLETETVEQIIEAIRLTPSCKNKQPWRYLFVQSDEGLAKARETLLGGNRAWAVTAPLLVIGYSKATDDCQIEDGRDYHQFDVGMATMNLMLVATEYGLTARPMAGYDTVQLKSQFGLEADDEPIIMVAVGKPGTDESYLPEYYQGLGDNPKARKKPDEITRLL
jgi:glutaredoxin-dependent peroxiredoxin